MTNHRPDPIATWLLQQAGWHVDRRIDRTTLHAWYAAHRYTLWQEADDFMTTFGMLTIDATTYSDTPIPRVALADDDQWYPCYFRQWNAAGFAITVDPHTIQDFSDVLPVWDRNPILQARDDAIPIGTCLTPFEPIPMPLILHRHGGLMTVHNLYNVDTIALKRIGETLPMMLSHLVRSCLVYGWPPAS